MHPHPLAMTNAIHWFFVCMNHCHPVAPHSLLHLLHIIFHSFLVIPFPFPYFSPILHPPFSSFFLLSSFPFLFSFSHFPQPIFSPVIILLFLCLPYPSVVFPSSVSPSHLPLFPNLFPHPPSNSIQYLQLHPSLPSTLLHTATLPLYFSQALPFFILHPPRHVHTLSTASFPSLLASLHPIPSFHTSILLPHPYLLQPLQPHHPVFH